MKLNRRAFSFGAAAAVCAPWVARASSNDVISVASIYDMSGGLEIYGQPIDACLDLAIAEINQSGGLLGKQVALKKHDPQSNVELYTRYATEVATSGEFSAAFAGISSASREAIRPIFRRYETLLFNSASYEGGVCDRNVFSTGTTPAQSIEALAPYTVNLFGKKIYIIAADYSYGHISARWFAKYTSRHDAKVVGEEYFPLDVTDFGATIRKIQEAKPDFVFSVLVGSNHMSFYRQWAAAGMSGRIPIASFSFGAGCEQIVLTPEEADGIVGAFGYVQEMISPRNSVFMDSYRDKLGTNAPYVTEIGANTYNAFYHWANGVRKAGTLDRMAVIEALEDGSSVDGPGGLSTIEPKTHHCISDIHITKVKNRALEVVQTFESRFPSDTAAVCNLQERPNDTQQYVID